MMKCKAIAYQNQVCIDCAKHCYTKAELMSIKMISLERFKETLQSIKDTEDKNRAFSKAMENISSSWFISELAYPVTTSLINLLKDIFNDEGEWIEWCIYERDWFTRTDLVASYKDGTPIKLDTPEELYHFLIDNMKNNYSINLTN